MKKMIKLNINGILCTIDFEHRNNTQYSEGEHKGEHIPDNDKLSYTASVLEFNNKKVEAVAYLSKKDKNFTKAYGRKVALRKVLTTAGELLNKTQRTAIWDEYFSKCKSY